ncbi:hypothetical protein C4D60_Mb00t00120 [Musa balbisiana]|uniref:Uncharacterized protein n=1 Tax=Musa balbisiana TaxID=52838 RepID=A0A4S8I6F8_MUSBA|nr:hypothetical protein C4D60_Mb00t00120 [Musa balbisiana]
MVSGPVALNGTHISNKGEQALLPLAWEKLRTLEARKGAFPEKRNSLGIYPSPRHETDPLNT